MPKKQRAKVKIDWVISEDERNNVTHPEYLNRLVGLHDAEYKFCEVVFHKHPYNPKESYHESWAGNWIYYEKECFLVLLFKVERSRLKVYCIGNDDCGYERIFEVEEEQEARSLFELISDGTSMKELRDLELVHI